MRRPRFNRWIRAQVLALAGTTSLNLRRITAQMQRSGDRRLAAALLLHAHENGQYTRLESYLYDEHVIAEFRKVESSLGARSIERLALRGTPMMSLPQEYRDLMARYVEAYYAPEHISEQKGKLLTTARAAILRSGTSPTEVARALHLDPGNTNAFFTRGETARFTLDTVRAIADYVA